jgi:hypothetical protein
MFFLFYDDKQREQKGNKNVYDEASDDNRHCIAADLPQLFRTETKTKSARL